MRKDEPLNRPENLRDHDRLTLRPALVTWRQDEARLERERRQRRRSRSIYIPPFPVDADPDPRRLRWNDQVPIGLKRLC